MDGWIDGREGQLDLCTRGRFGRVGRSFIVCECRILGIE